MLTRLVIALVHLLPTGLPHPGIVTTPRANASCWTGKCNHEGMDSEQRLRVCRNVSFLDSGRRGMTDQDAFALPLLADRVI